MSVHEPSALAASILARPASVICPFAISRAIRSLFGFDQPLPRLRGVKSCIVRSSSAVLAWLSIQPKQSASSTASG